MNTIKFFLLFNILYATSDYVRRIQGGDKVTSQKSYMVYLVKTAESVKYIGDWLCVGVLVNPWYIITAHSCVDNTDYMYAIAGYDTYVPDAGIEVDNCTKEKKKKVVYYCVPKLYEKNIEKWLQIDIALVKVESPYDFNDETYKEFCSYIPSSIPINFDQRFQKPGTDGLVLGWGHTEDKGQPGDKNNYLRYASIRIMDKEVCKQHFKQYPDMDINIIENNMICTAEKGELDENGKIVLVGDPPAKVDGCAGGLRLLSYDNEPCDEDQQRRRVGLKSNPTNDSNIKTKNRTLLKQANGSRKNGICQPGDKNHHLRYASIRIMDKEVCKQHFKHYPDMDINIIENNMICTAEKGELDENGKIVLVGDPPAKVDGCAGGLRLLSYDNEPCNEDQQRRRVGLRSNPTNDSNITKNDSNIKTKNRTVLKHANGSRKSGICQNDHGGPFVTWMGSKEVLIGVAAVFGVPSDSKCMGPYLFTSTACNGVFLDCVLNDLNLPNKTRREICDSPPIQRGYDITETHISWKDHPAGPADNEVLVIDKKFVVDRLDMNVRQPKTLEGVIKLDDEMIAVRPQRPLK